MPLTSGAPEGVDPHLGPQNQEESSPHRRHDREDLRLPVRPLRQELRQRRGPQHAHEAQAQLGHQDGAGAHGQGDMPGGGEGRANQSRFDLPTRLSRRV